MSTETIRAAIIARFPSSPSPQNTVASSTTAALPPRVSDTPSTATISPSSQETAAPDNIQVPTPPSPISTQNPSTNPLRQYSLLGHGLEVAERAQAQVPLLGSVCLAGQATIWFAGPNTGKTLMALRLLIDAIQAKRIDPNNVYYVNVDDSSSGLATKLNMLEEFGVHVLAEGYKGFRSSNFVSEIERMIALDQAKGQFIILDTLKKFVTVIDKKASSQFTNLLRRFVLKGGTILCLAHTNKRPGADGKPIYGGTSDFVDDFDCSYVISVVASDEPSNDRTILFDNNKRRGDVVQRACYTYSVEDGLSYEAMITSVRTTDPDLFEVSDMDPAASDADVIEAVQSFLSYGVTTKMKLAVGAAKLARVSQKTALGVIEKYTGEDPSRHLWTYEVQARGAKVFKPLPGAVAAEGEVVAPSD
ncbi:AAA family ATPase [Polymorphobacter sp. PAMC 29334]|uniref:AAA family ATPase n=1 Tax=Polymorphobacter sp. PAMC 29334 TaxID=2862331 RepID=UPI001C74B6AC|nr:AAA family ATPase [Polymorphobacter sp. PAMC 29334]QYE35134.1 AAA family ATPase [Polymorphobacter sp. PAMC 29334]